MIPYRDDTCPARAAGLSHHAEDPDYICAECDQQCMIETIVVEDEGAMLLVDIAEKECIVDHDSLISGYTPNTGKVNGVYVDGAHWARCVQCNTMVEKRHEKVGAQGAAWGPGRLGSARALAHDEALWGYMRWHYSKVEP